MSKKITIFFIFLVLFLSIGCKRNKPPEAPKIIGPKKVGVGAAVEYKAVTTDPNKDDIRYYFSWDGKKESTAFCKSGDTGKVRITFEQKDTYLLKVCAKDIKGAMSDSSSLTIEVVANKKPTPPTLTGPWVGLINKKYGFTARTTDPDNDSVQYKFMWGDGREIFTNWVASGTAVTESISYPNTGTYVIKVVAQDNKYAWSDTSEPIEFHVVTETVPNQKPNRPTLVGPTAGLINKKYGFTVRAIDPDNDSIRYKFIWGNESTRITNWVASGTAVTESISYADTGIYVIKALAQDKKYAWSDTSNSIRFEVKRELEPGDIIFVFTADDEILSSPAITIYGGDTLVIFGDNDGNIYAIKASTGALKYKGNGIPGEDFSSSPVIGPDGVIYIGSEGGRIYAFNPNLTRKWVYPDSAQPGLGSFTATPVLSVDGNKLFIGSDNDTLYCLSTANGQVLRKFKAKGSIEGCCIMDNQGNVYFGESDSGYFYKLNPNGDSLWAIYLGEGIQGQGAIGNNLVYVAVEGKIYGISFDGQIVHSASLRDTSPIYGGPVIGWNGKVIVATEDGMMQVFDPTLTLIHSYQKTGDIKSTPCLAGEEDKVLYFNNDADYLYAINPLTENGSEYFSVRLSSAFAKMSPADFISSPVVGNNGIVYVANDKYLFAIVGYKRLPLANTPWPMFQHDPKHTGRAGGKK